MWSRPGTRDNPEIARSSPSPDSPSPGPPPPEAPASPSERRRPASRALEWALPEENPAGLIYGVIVIGALLAAESDRHETYLDALASTAIAAALYWLAHAYAGVLGRRLSSQERLTGATLLRALGHDWALIRGAAIPLLALLVCWAAGVAQQTAVTAALWSAVLTLVLLELLAGLRSRATPGELALEVAVGMAMGMGILALKIVLH